MKYEFHNEEDHVSDDLIRTITDSGKSSAERKVATQKLYHLHSAWVYKQVEKKIYDPEDVMDITQNVWFQVLKPENLEKNYTNRAGKFRAFLRKPINWAILKHIDRLPFTLDEAGKKVSVSFVQLVDEVDMDHGVDDHIYQEVIENIIKPNLKGVALKPRNVFMTNEYESIFTAEPVIPEVAVINDISVAHATELFESAAGKLLGNCTDEELSVFMPVEYRRVIDEDIVRAGGGEYLATMLNMSHSAFRKYLHTARRSMIEIVQKHFDGIESGSNRLG